VPAEIGERSNIRESGQRSGVWDQGQAGGENGHILDLGCGTGEVARRASPDVQSITAIDRSARMIAEARQRAGGDAQNVEWIVGRVEELPLSRTFTLALAAESFHWFDWGALCPLLAGHLNSCPVVLVERREVASSWDRQLRSLIAKFSTNRDFQPYDLVEELVGRSCYSVSGHRVFGPGPFTQSIDDYLTSIHSRNGFSRDRMHPEAVCEFDCAVRSAVQPHARNDALTLQIETHVFWGRVLKPTRG
jgi:SAM-dependent methyltransferase